VLVQPADDEVEEGDFLGDALPPREPTDYAPGTFEKVAILEARAALRCSLWHPEDSRADPAFPRDVEELLGIGPPKGRTWGRRATVRRARRMLYDEGNRG
jgi:hypothetical protein